MFFFFIFSKIVLTVFAAYFISQVSPWIVLIFALFIAVDLIDSKIMGLDYRPYDSFFDRLFAYVCFLTYLAIAPSIYPAVVYIAAFGARDFFVAGAIQDSGNYSVRSNTLDRITMFLVATLFAFQAGGALSASGRGIEGFCYLIATLILIQGVIKIERIRKTKKPSYGYNQ